MGLDFSSGITVLLESWTQENFLSATVSFEAGRRQKAHGWCKVGTSRSLRQDFDRTALRDYGPCFVNCPSSLRPLFGELFLLWPLFGEMFLLWPFFGELFLSRPLFGELPLVVTAFVWGTVPVMAFV